MRRAQLGHELFWVLRSTGLRIRRCGAWRKTPLGRKCRCKPIPPCEKMEIRSRLEPALSRQDELVSALDGMTLKAKRLVLVDCNGVLFKAKATSISPTGVGWSTLDVAYLDPYAPIQRECGVSLLRVRPLPSKTTTPKKGRRRRKKGGSAKKRAAAAVSVDPTLVVARCSNDETHAASLSNQGGRNSPTSTASPIP